MRFKRLFEKAKKVNIFTRVGACLVAVSVLLAGSNYLALANTEGDVLQTENVIAQSIDEVATETPSDANAEVNIDSNADSNTTISEETNVIEQPEIMGQQGSSESIAELEKDEDENEDENKELPLEKSVRAEGAQGIVITVSADAGVFPNDSIVEARLVTADEADLVTEAINEVREEGHNVAASYTFDITVYDKDGKEIEPDTEKGSVKVTFKMEEIANENLETEVYHVEETEEGLNVTELITEEVKGNGNAVSVETDGFSYYTVDFTYGELKYVLDGGSWVSLKEILDYLGIVGEVKDAVFSDPELVDVSKNEDGEWIVTSLKSFTTDEKLVVTIGGIDFDIDFEIGVTDPFYLINIKSFIAELNQSGQVSKYVLVADYYDHAALNRCLGLLLVPEEKESIVCNTTFRVRGSNYLDYYYRYPGGVEGAVNNPNVHLGVEQVDYPYESVNGILTEYKVINTKAKGSSISLDINGFYNNATLDTEKSYSIFVMGFKDNGGQNTFYNICGDEDAKVSMGSLLPISLKLYKEDPNNLGRYITIAETTTHFVEGTTISYDSWPVETLCGKGYHFNANTSSGAGICTSQSGEKSKSNRKGPDVVIYYDLDRFTVDFNANGGSGAPTSTENAYGTKITAPTTKPTREGHTFGGWYKEAACTNAWNFETDTVTSATTLYAKWIYNVASVTHEGAVTYYDSLQKAVNAATNGDTVQLLVDTTENVTIASGKSITLDLNGKVIKGTGSGTVVTVNSNASLTINDSNTSASHTGEYASLPAGGVICGGNNVSHGGGVLIYGGTFTMNAGTITGNTATDSGGGVCVGKSSVTLTTPSAFIMNGGTITGNTGTNWGGGVCVGSSTGSNSTFTMNAGSISDNTSYDGGGVHVGGNGTFNTFNMRGGTISGNSSTGSGANGGGGVSVYLFSANTQYNFVMTGGTITGNTALGNGGGVNIRPNNGEGTLTVGGEAKITGNTKNSTANNMYIGSGRKITLTTGVDAPKAGMSVGVTTGVKPTANAPVEITGDNGANFSSYFTSDDSAYEIRNVENVLKLMKAGTITNNTPETGKTTNNGYITINKTSAFAGEEITVEVIPNTGYALNSLKYNDGSDHDITTAKKFTMPNGDVGVTAVFAHSHSFTYSVDSSVGSSAPNVLKATCIEGCPGGYHDNPLTLTLTASSDLGYDGIAKEVILPEGEKSSWSAIAELGGVPTVIYVAKDGSSLTDGKAVNAGSYTASITVSNTTASCDFTITKAESEVTTAPTAKTLTYDTTEQELVTAGTAVGGTLQYNLDGGEYSNEIPKVVNAGEYKVNYRVVGDSNHTDTEPEAEPITITVAKASREASVIFNSYKYGQKEALSMPELDPAPAETPLVKYYYNTTESSTGGTEWKYENMTATTLDVGTYYMYAKIDETDNYQEYTTAPREFKVEQPAAPIQMTDGNVITKIDKNGKVSEIVSDFGGRRLTETKRDESGAVLEEGNYDKKVEKTDGEKSIDYIVTYTFTGNYTGTVVKRISVAKPSEEPDPPENPNDDILTRVDKENAGEYAPVVEKVPESKVKSVIINDLNNSDAGKKAKIEKQLVNSEASVSTVEGLAQELGREDRDVSIVSNLVLEMEAKREEKIMESPEGQQDVALIKAAVESINHDSQIGYLDISMYVTYTLYENSKPIVEMSKQKVTDTQALGDGKDFESTITIEVPESMRSNIPQNMRRTYYVGRVHDGNYTELTRTNDTRITFKTGKFSTYALFYKDSEIPKEDPSPSGSGSSNNQNAVVAPVATPQVVMLTGFYSPKTGDSYEIYVWAGLLLMGLGLMVFRARKKKAE